MSNQTLFIIMGAAGGAFILIIALYYIISKRSKKSEYKQIAKLQKGTKVNKYSTEILYQKLYVTYIRIPFVKRYMLKLRRRLEILNIDDEYKTRHDSAKVMTKALCILIPLVAITIALIHNNLFLLSIILLFELFMVDSIVDSSVDKLDDNLLKQQIDFFSEIRHAYHEFNMVEEAIYQVSQDDEMDVSSQGDKIYEILISDDPETELEKYYDIAPNSYLKEFAGLSYLTKEFGDRKINGASLYLKNVDNITQEMQLEILKRDKLNYVFQSLAFIAVAPILLMEPLKKWAIGNFSFVESWYQGKPGMIVQIIVVILTVICYILVRKLKDNGSTAASTQNTENPWQAKLYKKAVFKKIVDLFMPKEGTKDYRKMQKLLKDAASKSKMEWVYVNRITSAIVVFIASLVIFMQIHEISIKWVYTEPTTDYDLIGGLSENQKKKAMQVTEEDNTFLDKFKGQLKTTEEDIEKAIRRSEYYVDAKEEDIAVATERIYKKLQTVNSEYMTWLEFLMAAVLAIVGYMGPVWILYFQLKMRQLEMEDEVMQFQTIILMLMRIERVNVEIILEWLERYSNIFYEPITRCVNNYEAGPWEALEELKNDVTYEPFIRIVESLQAAVEKIPIRDAFDELDSERDYYREKRKESNERLIKRKGMIGKGLGFAPMIVMFCLYLLVPLVFVGLTSMSSSFTSMQNREF